MNMYAMFRYRVVLTIFLIGFGLCSGVLLAQNIPVARNRSYGQYGRDDEARPE